MVNKSRGIGSVHRLECLPIPISAFSDTDIGIGPPLKPIYQLGPGMNTLFLLSVYSGIFFLLKLHRHCDIWYIIVLQSVKYRTVTVSWYYRSSWAVFPESIIL